MWKDFTTLKIALDWWRQFIFFRGRDRTKAIFGLMCIGALIDLSALILIKAAWLMFRQSNTTDLGMAGRTCLVLCYQIPNFSSMCEAYSIFNAVFVIIPLIFIIFGSKLKTSVYFLRCGVFFVIFSRCRIAENCCSRCYRLS